MAQTTTDDTASLVRAELARQRKSGRELAKALGWSERTTRRRLAGETAFRITELPAISRELGIPLTDLIPVEPAA